jgi:phosphate acetyltransferase
MNFIESVKEKARQNKKTIVLPETQDKRTLYAAEIILKEGFANLVLIGDEKDLSQNEFRELVGDDEILVKKDFDLSGAKFISPSKYERMEEFVEKLYELRKSKGVTREEARNLLRNPLYFGAMLVREGVADGMTAGAAHTTGDVLRPSLQFLKTKKDAKLVSAFFILITPYYENAANGSHIFIFADCGLNQRPNSEELANIALSSAQSYKSFVGGEPVVAMLSHSTMGSAKHTDVDVVAEAVKIAKSLAPDLEVDGEFQLDAAIVPEISRTKAPHSSVGGRANVLIFPNLDAGNIGYKLVQRLGKAEAYGPILQGIGKPVNDLSRGCYVEDIVGVVAITAVQAQLEY